MTKYRFLWILLIALGIVVVLLVLRLAMQAPVEAWSGDGLPSFVYGIALLVFLVAGVLAHRHVRPGKILTALAIWLALIVALVPWLWLPPRGNGSREPADCGTCAIPRSRAGWR